MARKRTLQTGSLQRGVMTLRAVLLLFTGSLVLLLLATSVYVSFDRFRDYVADQLTGHAQDGATAIGVSLSNAIDGRDPVAAASLIDAVFDSGRYLSVIYLNNEGERVAERFAENVGDGVPGWFIEFVRLPLPPGEAEVVRGWNRLGRVQVVSHPGRAYQDLWRIALGLVGGGFMLGLAGLLLLYLLLKRILRPLREVERQAEALGQRDFRRRVHVTSTRELNRVTQAMNQMADDLGDLFQRQARLIQHLRQINNEDLLTGLASRNAFDQRLRVEVETKERGTAPGVLFLLQLADFGGFNQTFGRARADQLLVAIATAIHNFVRNHSRAFAGRRTGAEFAVFMPGASRSDAMVWGRQLVEKLGAIYAEHSGQGQALVHAGAAQAGQAGKYNLLMAAADEALRQAQSRDESVCQLADLEERTPTNAETWRQIISEAVSSGSVSLWEQPVCGCQDNAPVYHQVISRIRSNGEWLKAGIFIPIAERFGLVSKLDRVVVEQTLALLRERPDDTLAVSLGAASVASRDFHAELARMLRAAGPDRQRLWVGISEQTVRHHRTAVGLLVRLLRRLWVPVIVDHFGVGGVPFSYIKNLPLRAVRIDISFIHGIDHHPENRFYLESVVGIAHSRGVQVFVSGVETAEEWATVCRLGIDGGMGYHLGRPFDSAAEEQPGAE